MKKQNRTPSKSRKPGAVATALPAINSMKHPDAAGIDVGAEEFVVAVPPGRGDGRDVRTFSTFTSGVEAVCHWLVACGIQTAAMESTGNYWICLYDALVAAGVEVYLVNARHIKGVPGRKTDVCDAQWLQHLHAAGLLRKSYRPAGDIVPLRYLMRHRAGMVEESAKQVQLMQKSLTEMNIKIQHVFSDIDGVSAQRIIDAILAGERNPITLAALRDCRCRSPIEKILEALRGDYRVEYLFVLKQSQQAWRNIQAAIAECDEQIAGLIAGVACAEREKPAAEARTFKLNKNSPLVAIAGEAYRFYGTRLEAIDGVGSGVLCSLMSELGTREQLLESFRSPERFCSWLGLCPDNRISGGKVLKAKTRKVPNRVAKALRLAVFGLQRSESKLAGFCRRMKARLGKAEGIVAAAHKLARIIYAMIKNQCAYDENQAFRLSPQNQARRIKTLGKQAASLGYQLVPAV